MQSGVCDLRGLISGFFWGCWLVFFHIAILLGESLLFFAPMFSFVIGWQSSSKLMGNEVNAHTALIHPQFLWDLETVLALDYVVCPFVCSFLAWFVLLTVIPTICYSLPWFIWLFLSPWYVALCVCFCNVVLVNTVIYPRTKKSSWTRKNMRSSSKKHSGNKTDAPIVVPKNIAVVINPPFSSVLTCFSYSIFWIATAVSVFSMEISLSSFCQIGAAWFVWSKTGFSLICKILFHSLPLKHQKTTLIAPFNCALMTCLCMALSVPGVQAVPGHNEGAISGAYALMALSKVVGNVASYLNSDNREVDSTDLQIETIHDVDISEDEFAAAVVDSQKNKNKSYYSHSVAGGKRINEVDAGSDDDFEPRQKQQKNNNSHPAKQTKQAGCTESNIIDITELDTELGDHQHFNDDKENLPETNLPVHDHVHSPKLHDTSSVTVVGVELGAKPVQLTSLYKGQEIDTTSLYEVRKGIDKFCSDIRGFQVGTAEGSDLRDKPKCRRLRMRCSLGGISKKKRKSLQLPKKDGIDKVSTVDMRKVTLPSPVERKSSSLKVGCSWEVTVIYSPEIGKCKVKDICDEHSNGCVPSLPQQALVRARTGKLFSHIPTSLAVTLRFLLNSNTKYSHIRELMRELHLVQDGEPIFAQQLFNLKLRFSKQDAELTNWEKINWKAPITELSTEDEKTIERYARDWVQETMNEGGGQKLIELLKSLKLKYPGFQYRISQHKGVLTGWMIMTAEQQYLAKMYGQVIFMDFKKSGISVVNWPYQGPAVIDEENHVRVVAYSMTCTESNESYGFSLTSMTSIVPELHKITEVIVTDRLPSEDIFLKLLKSIHQTSSIVQLAFGIGTLLSG